jgi:hypothetical protein
MANRLRVIVLLVAMAMGTVVAAEDVWVPVKPIVSRPTLTERILSVWQEFARLF